MSPYESWGILIFVVLQSPIIAEIFDNENPSSNEALFEKYVVGYVRNTALLRRGSLLNPPYGHSIETGTAFGLFKKSLTQEGKNLTMIMEREKQGGSMLEQTNDTLCKLVQGKVSPVYGGHVATAGPGAL